MRLSSIFAIAVSFLLAAAFCLVAAGFAATVIEDNARSSVRSELAKEGLTWVEVEADGLQVLLAGTAPSEAKRFSALTAAARMVDAARVIDQMQIEDSAGIAPPRFSVEILRNDSGISLIGLIPAQMDRAAFLKQLSQIAGAAEVSDLLDAADYPVAEGWAPAVDYALHALRELPRAKISISAGRVAITSIADSPEAKRTLEQSLKGRVPGGLRVSLEIAAPRPVITPFTLRFVIEDGEARFDACSADTPESQREILKAASDAGLSEAGLGEAECIIGLGVPTPEWGRAAALAIKALGGLGNGSVTFADADITLIAAAGTPEASFDDVVGGLTSDLPDVFALHAVLTPPDDGGASAEPDFTANLTAEGQVHLRGRLGSQRLRDTVDSFARARFRSDAVHTKVRVTEGLPAEWPVRVLSGLEALGFLAQGVVVVTPENLTVTGQTGRKDGSAQIAGLLAEKLGKSENFDINVSYDKRLDPLADVPTPPECIARITEILEARKINFEPSSSTIDNQGAAIMDDIADILKKCGEIQIEIGGHTDSQGREEMNAALSQSRANAVLDALRARRVLTSSFATKGYGESQPIAANNTEEGREANRRIEFKLIEAGPAADTDANTDAAAPTSGLEDAAEAGQEGAEASEGATSTGDEQN